MQKTDILVIGSGIAGLFFAIKTAESRPDLSIVIMTKDAAENTNTKLAQGGIAVVVNSINDSFEQHIQDTLKSGGGLCDKEIVKMVVHQAPERLQELIAIGASFDKNQSGKWNLGLEGGHSQHRILHHKDNSGWEIENKLLQKARQLPTIELLENHLAIELTTEKNSEGERCSGAFYHNKITGKTKHIRAKIVILSTGGCGQVFQNTTNPEIATGDGTAMACRAGTIIEDMHYIQFHPTALYEKNKNPFFLLSEAVRGFGAHIINENQKRFLFKYDIRGELATRDVVSRTINLEMEESGKKYVYLDCRHLDAAEFYSHFPSITDYCKNIGLNPCKDLLPIVPVAHYQCGGIKVDRNSETSIKNLYAIGECAKTGLHGKNRLASNSLLEALVFAHQASLNVGNTIDTISFSSKVFMPKYPEALDMIEDKALAILKKELKAMMTSFYANGNQEIHLALSKIELMKTKAEAFMQKEKMTLPLIEFVNMLTVASIIIEHSKKNILSNTK